MTVMKSSAGANLPGSSKYRMNALRKTKLAAQDTKKRIRYSAYRFFTANGQKPPRVFLMVDSPAVSSVYPETVMVFFSPSERSVQQEQVLPIGKITGYHHKVPCGKIPVKGDYLPGIRRCRSGS